MSQEVSNSTTVQDTTVTNVSTSVQHPRARKISSQLETLLWQYENNRSITTEWHHVFLVLYILIGIVAFFANGLVVLAVFRNKKVRFVFRR